MAVLVLLVVRDAKAVGMDRYLSQRYWAYAIPSYFSEVTYGAPRYTYFFDLSMQFLKPPPFGDPATFQRLLTEASAGRLQASGAPHLFPADEKGTVDFVRFAFRLFGVHVQSLFYLYCTLLALSVGVFAWRFHTDSEALLQGVIAMAALYVAIGTFPITKELYSVTNPRAIGSLSIISLVHLSLAALRRDQLTVGAVAQLAFQAAMLVFVITMRTAETWQLVALVMITLAGTVQAGGSRNVSQFLPVALTMVWLAAFGVYQVYAYPPEYFSQNLRTKIVWHNVLIGFALHPGLAEWYHLRVDDGSVLNFIEDRAGRDTAPSPADIFWTADETADGMVKNFREYERLCREAAWELAAAHPLQTLKLFAWYKPRTFRYAIGRGPADLRYYSLQDQAVSLLTPGERLLKGAFFNPFSPVPLLIVLSACIAAGAGRVRATFNRSTWIALALIVCASLIPAAVTYPLIHVIAGAYWTVALLCYAVIARLAVEIPLIRRVPS
jgi:hypothetical protein